MCGIGLLRAPEGTPDVDFRCRGDDGERYAFIGSVVARLAYRRLGGSTRASSALPGPTTGYSRQQLTRLIGRCLNGQKLPSAIAGRPRGSPACTRRPTSRCSPRPTPCINPVGPGHPLPDAAGVRRLWRCPLRAAGHPLGGHLYNLRRQAGYQASRLHWTKTQGHAVPIGERRAPAPDGRPGFIRIDSVHQGDQDGVKGLYHINAVDCVTQFEVVATCERLSEAYLLPVLEQILAGFPFEILGFHADNGSEYVNYTVAELLDKLRIEFTKSRPRHSNDNGLAETKNGAVVRKLFGYEHIPQRWAAQVNTFCRDYLNPFLNFHRPCLFATRSPTARARSASATGSRTANALDKLRSLPDAAQFLQPGVAFAHLDALAAAITDVQAARGTQRGPRGSSKPSTLDRAGARPHRAHGSARDRATEHPAAGIAAS